MKSQELRWFLLTFGVVVGLSLLLLAVSDDDGDVAAFIYFPPTALMLFHFVIVPVVAVVASIASAWVGRGRVETWLAAYAGVVAGTLPWWIVGMLTGRLPWGLAEILQWPYAWAVIGPAVILGLVFAVIPYLVGIPFLLLRRWTLGRNRNSTGADTQAIPPRTNMRPTRSR